MGDVKTQQISGSATGDSYFYMGLHDQLHDFHNITNYGGLFDRYRILRLRYKFWWDHTVYDPAITNTVDNQKTSRPVVYIAKDYDDATTPSAISEVLDYRNCKRYMGTSFGFSFKPSVQMDVDVGSGASIVKSPKWKVWLDLLNTYVWHYGLKVGIWIPVNMMPQALRWQVTCTVQFAGRR